MTAIDAPKPCPRTAASVATCSAPTLDRNSSTAVRAVTRRSVSVVPLTTLGLSRSEGTTTTAMPASGSAPSAVTTLRPPRGMTVINSNRTHIGQPR